MKQRHYYKQKNNQNTEKARPRHLTSLYRSERVKKCQQGNQQIRNAEIKYLAQRCLKKEYSDHRFEPRKQ